MFNKPTFLPDTPTREQVLFSWALGEAYSPRWRDAVLASVTGNLRGKLERGETADFTTDEKSALIQELSMRRPWFISEYIDKSTRFRITHIPSRFLGNIPVLPTFSWQKEPVSLTQYLAMESKEEWTDDPRQAAKKLMANPPSPPYAGLPIVAYSDELTCDILIDGYARCLNALIKMQQGAVFPPVPIIYCERK